MRLPSGAARVAACTAWPTTNPPNSRSPNQSGAPPTQPSPSRRTVTNPIVSAVTVEFDLLGTHDGPLGGIPPTGQAFRCPMVAFFFFEPDGEGIVCERVYFDSATILRQLKVSAS